MKNLFFASLASLSVIVAFPASAQENAAFPSGPYVVAFDDMHQLVSAAQRQRIISRKIGFTIEVDETGKAGSCELHYDFRRKATENAICRPLMKMRFEPARDAQNNAISADYTSVIDFRTWMTQEGYMQRPPLNVQDD